MVVFRVQTGLQVRFFEGVSFAQVVQQAIAAQVPALSIKAGKFFVEQALDTDSKAQALIESL